jgi:uncharacterized protein (TIGR02266 family)
VAFESASGEVHEADVANLSREGLFVGSATQVPVGKRLSLDIKVAGEPAPWAALGRVVWVRQTADGDALPAGMAVKFIDVDDVVVAAIDRLIEARERTEPGLGEKAAPRPRERPLREKTMLGVGGFGVPSPAAPTAPPASPVPAPEPKAASLPLPATPAVPFVPSRERTVLGIGRDALGDDTREPSLAIDLVAKKPPSKAPPPPTPEEPLAEALPAPVVEPPIEHAPAQAMREPQPVEPPEPSLSEAAVPKRSSGVGWWLLLIALIGGGAACYVFRDQLLPLWRQVVATVMRNIR